MSGRAARRTRLYDASYNIGENYYKSALDGIDRKRYGRRDPVEAPTVLSSSRPRVNFDDSVYDDELVNARRRAEKAITEETFFDSKGTRVAKSSVKPLDDIDEEIQASLNRIRASKKQLTAIDDDLDDTISSFKRRARIDLGEKLDDSVGAGSGAVRATLKVVTRRQEVEPVESSSLAKWTKLTSNNEESHTSAASLRAQASKARLQELDADICERSERQLAREKRSAQLKQFLLDSDIETTSRR